MTNRKASARDAKQICEDHNGHLAVIHDKFEEEQVRQVVRGKSVWIGLEKVNGMFKWLGKRNLEYSNWNSNATFRSNEPCVVMDIDGTWNTEACEHSSTFHGICEKESWKDLHLEKLENSIVELEKELLAIRDKLSNH